jgi:CDP-glycerol glycerophosphotransferase (TagB/SpsB family)
MSDFSTGSSEYQNLAMLDTVIAWSRSQHGARVIHKMHPGEELEYYAAAGRGLGWDPLTLTTIREPILYDVLERSDLLVTAYSSTVLEALVLGTPAIVFDGMVQRKLLHDGPTPLTRVPGVTIVYSSDALRQQLDARRSAPPFDRLALRASPELREYLSGLDGEATARVAALLG